MFTEIFKTQNKLEYQEKTTNLPQVTDIEYTSTAINRIRTHNACGDRHWLQMQL
jgi:hypothetical protein